MKQKLKQKLKQKYIYYNKMGNKNSENTENTENIIMIVIIVILGLIIYGLLIYLIFDKRLNCKKGSEGEDEGENNQTVNPTLVDYKEIPKDNQNIIENSNDK